jgi:hypothetical protein
VGKRAPAYPRWVKKKNVLIKDEKGVVKLTLPLIISLSSMM